jgi:hypothetical protein
MDDLLRWLLGAATFFAGGAFTMVWVSRGVWENDKKPPTIWLLLGAFFLWWVVLPINGIAALGETVIARTKPQAIKDAEHDEQLRLENAKLDQQLAEAKGEKDAGPGFSGFSIAPEGSWVCRECGTRLKHARSVVRHRDIAHLRPQADGQYHCPLCLSTRVTIGALKSHYDTYHMP